MIQVGLMQMIMQQFEGPEKKLEIILTAPNPAMRDNQDHKWDRVVRASGAEILSHIATENIDAYLLSESSLFVWEDRILMLTCGRTTLINAVPEILQIVHRDQISHLFYERKNLVYPQHQPSDFRKDAAYLDGFFPGQVKRLGPADSDHVHVFNATNVPVPQSRDITLELLMHDINPDIIRLFQKAPPGSAETMERELGIDRLLPQMKRDSYLFDPAGYSTNGIASDRYFTIHVTPEPEASYVSFETNVLEPDYAELIRRVTLLFRPTKFTLVLTTSNDPETKALHAAAVSEINGYRSSDEFRFNLDCDYTVTFINYVTF